IRKEGPTVYTNLFQTADLITVNSQYTFSCLEKLGCPSKKLRHLPESLNPDEFQFHERALRPGDPLRILSVGRLVEKKGHEYTIRALAKLPANEFELDIVGDGPLRAALESLATELGVI